MNVSELARRIHVNPEELKARLPELGFDIGMRAIKIDDRVANKIIEQWPILRRQLEKLRSKSRDAVATAEIKAVAAAAAPIKLPPVVTVRDFAAALNVPVTRLISELMKNGILASLNERIDFDTATIVAEDLGFKVEREEAAVTTSEAAGVDRLKEIIESEAKENLMPRPPVLVVMGHVDHGKTKLLDAIRKTDVVAGEAGGITQHIGAYQTKKNGRLLTFIDTPGHEAFSAMRSRGARVADIAILVVAADDGVQPQTKEAVKIIEAAKLPFVVAMNKVDKPEADPEKVKRELSELNILGEDWGGKVPMIPLSAKTGAGIDKLLEVLLLVADLERDKIVANPARRAVGTIIESHVDKGIGVLATVLIQTGTLKKNDVLALGSTFGGKVRAMKDYRGVDVKEAPPGTPVQIVGFKMAPTVGDIVEVAEGAAALERVKPKRVSTQKMSAVERIQAPAEEGKEVATLNLVLRADVLGSLEAIVVALERFKHPEVAVKVIAKGLGNVTDADVSQAEAGAAQVIGFNVQVPPAALDQARTKNVKVKTYRVIYDLLNAVRDDLQTLLPPEVIRTDYGDAKILAVFRTERDSQILGGVVTEGKAVFPSDFIFKRNDDEYRGSITSLQANKREVTEVRGGTEFGMKVKTKTPLAEGDVIHFFRETKKERKLNL